MKDLAGRAAVVTGGGSGIGRGICLALADAGVNVVVADVEQDAADAVGEEVRARNVTAVAVRTDVADSESVQSLADAAFSTFGTIEILCNNAGVNVRPFRATWDTSLADFRWLIGVNVWGVVHGVMAFVPRMRLQPGQKHLVNTSSFATIEKAPGLAAYTMTKCAVDGLTEIMREELRADSFGVTTLHPGPTRTNIAKSTRLRSSDEKEANSQVPEWRSYADRASGRTGTDEGIVWLDPEITGRMVVDAIRDNRSYCLSHPAPREEIEARASALVNAYVPPGQFTGGPE